MVRTDELTPFFFLAIFLAVLVAGDNARGDTFIGSIIVSSDMPGDTDYLSIYSLTGDQLHSVSLDPEQIIGPSAIAARPRGVALDANGNIQLFYGTFGPRLYTYNPITSTATSTPIENWGLVNNVYYGSIASYGNYVFLPDTVVSGAPGAGVIRVDINSLSAEHFPMGLNTSGGGVVNATVGLDDLLYVTFSYMAGISVYNPDTMAQINNITSSHISEKGFAVDADGTIFQGIYNKIRKIAPDGSLIEEHSFATENSNLDGFIDVDIRPDGLIVASNGYGQILVTDKNFSTASVFEPFLSHPDTFVSFFEYPTPEPGCFVMVITGVLSILSCRRIRR
ncbi:MAG: hypothetical protein JXM70_07165 [Pirellulales bacterium]|nr:hypothetical protein [Pirellulales bacterium]